MTSSTLTLCFTADHEHCAYAFVDECLQGCVQPQACEGVPMLFAVCPRSAAAAMRSTDLFAGSRYCS